jgi:hypothetical protein
MSHDTSKVLMGGTGSSHKEVTNYPSIAGVAMEAGLACILESSGKVSLDTSEGALVGISLGKDLSDTGRTVVCRKGLRVPVKLKAGFNPTIGGVVAIEDDTGLARAYTGTGDRYVNAVFATGRIGGSGATGGIAEGATSETGSVGVAFIDFPGGL